MKLNIDRYMKTNVHFLKQENGFYVESGAYDGETLSNTLMLERMRNWNGLLVEPNPDVFTKLIKKNRKAYAINACLSTEAYPKKVSIDRTYS